MPCWRFSIGFAAASLLLGAGVHAGPITAYTDFNAYRADVAGLGPEQREGFDDLPALQDIAEGTAFGGFRFDAFDLDGAILQVAKRSGQTSSDANALETKAEPDGSFVGGDGFRIASALPLRAFGLFVISADALVDGDLTLMIEGEPVNLLAVAGISGAPLWTDFDFDFAEGTNAQLWFLGAIATIPFTEVVLSSRAETFAFSLDDLRATAAVPLPPGWTLLLPGLAALTYWARPRPDRRCTPTPQGRATATTGGLARMRNQSLHR